jgi:hypothetical protein
VTCFAAGLVTSEWGPLIKHLEVFLANNDVNDDNMGAYCSSLTYILSATPSLVTFRNWSNMPAVVLYPLAQSSRLGVGIQNLGLEVGSRSGRLHCSFAVIINQMPSLISLKLQLAAEDETYDDISRHPLKLLNLKTFHVSYKSLGSENEPEVREIFSWLGRSRFHQHCAIAIDTHGTLVEVDHSLLLNPLWAHHQSKDISLMWADEGDIPSTSTLFASPHLQNIHFSNALPPVALIPRTHHRPVPTLHLHTWIPVETDPNTPAHRDIDEDAIWTFLDELYVASSKDLPQLTVYVHVVTDDPSKHWFSFGIRKQYSQNNRYIWHSTSSSPKQGSYGWVFMRRMDAHRRRLREVGVLLIDGSLD